jgi:hypothetical protein
MRKLFSLSLILVLATFAMPARADDKAPAGATGTWKWTQSFGGNDVETTLKLKQDGDKVTGTISGFQGNEDQIKDGKVDGDKVTFKVTRDFGGNTMVTTYTCTVSGESLKGKAETVIARDFDAKKAKE